MISKGYYKNQKENKLKFIYKNKNRYYCTGYIVKKHMYDILIKNEDWKFNKMICSEYISK